MADYKWNPIEDLPADWTKLASSELAGLASVWREHYETIKDSKALKQFNERLRREWAIETGIIENLYYIDRGVTLTLIEKGIEASLIPHGTTDKPAELIVPILKDQEEVVTGLFDFVGQKRQLSTSYIKQLHQALTQHQRTTAAKDSFGQMIEVELLRGDWKKLPNNPTKSDGSIHEYCPPEQVASEMDQLIAWHQEHLEKGVPPEVEAAWLHHRFTQIHPFQDGNGRMARTLASLIFLRAGLFPLVVNRDDRSDYLDALETADRGDLRPLMQLCSQSQQKAINQTLRLSETFIMAKKKSIEAEDQRVIGRGAAEDEQQIELSLRPQYLREYIGQKKVKDNLGIFIKAAVARGEALDHVLLNGPPGLGKTTLAAICAREMAAKIQVTSGPVIEKPGDLAAMLTNLEEGDVLFIDEIHRLHPAIEEILYPAMEDFELDLIIGQGPSARSVKLDLPRFTLIGATTRAGLITAPLRGRFGINFHLDFYPIEDLEIIVLRSADILKVEIDAAGAHAIARRSRGTPRIANRLLRRVRDFAEVEYEGKITAEVADDALNRMEVDRFGLDEVDRKMLTTIIEKFGGGPVGVSTISAAIQEEKDAIEEIYEPYLIQIGFINRTPRGRVVMPAAYHHLGINLPGASDQPGLF